MTRDELEAMRLLLDAAKRQWLPPGMRVVALQLVRGYGPDARIVVYGCDEAFSEFVLVAREDMDALLKALEAIVG
jgi:hypothetical protein